MMLIIKNQTKNVEELLMEYERSKGITLPEAFVSFICKYNGGQTPETTLDSLSISTDVREFYGFGEVPYSYNDVIPEEIGGIKVLPIAVDSFGNMFVITLDGTSHVWFLDYEKDNTYTPVAESFTEFIEKCASKPIRKATVKSPQEREQEFLQKGRNVSEGLREMWRAEYEKYCGAVQEEVHL